MMRRLPSSPLRALASLLVLPLLAAPASATWSIVAVDRSTGEVAIATATCLEGSIVGVLVPIVWVGQGVAASQANVNVANHKLIRNAIRDGLTPQEVLDQLFAAGNTTGAQFGITTFAGPAVNWSAGAVLPAKPTVVGELGPVSYAIQGNVLAGDLVVLEAERAFRETEGDLSQRMLAGMLAAARAGGDGRCSCSQAMPTACGAPPEPFTKSAHAARMIVARVGDTNGGCNGLQGCASGTYWLDLEFPGTAQDPDPVLQLHDLYVGWRAALRGRPDHVLSRVRAGADRLSADGESTLEVLVRLVDVEGHPLTAGGALLDVRDRKSVV